MHPLFVHPIALASLSVTLVACASTSAVTGHQAGARSLRIARLADVDAPQSAVWDTWTSTDGVRTFLSPEANISAVVGGPYELLFAPGRSDGLRGTENCTVIAAVPERKLSFEVIAPPSLGLGDVRTQVTVRMTPLDEDTTRIQIVHEGFVQGPGWQDAHLYYSGLWTNTLSRLRARFAEGPVDWSTVGADFEWQ